MRWFANSAGLDHDQEHLPWFSDGFHSVTVVLVPSNCRDDWHDRSERLLILEVYVHVEMLLANAREEQTVCTDSQHRSLKPAAE